MTYRICRAFEIESGHMLSRHPDNCKYPHGHTRKVEVVLQADELDANQMVCDYKVIKNAVADALDRLDHAMCMNTEDPAFDTFKSLYGDRIIAFEGEDPTTEVMARRIHEICIERLGGYRDDRYPLREGVQIVRVRVWETADTWAEYAES